MSCRVIGVHASKDSDLNDRDVKTSSTSMFVVNNHRFIVWWVHSEKSHTIVVLLVSEGL